jgi:hypothetical protein
VDNDQNSSQGVHPQRDEALLAFGVRIVDCYGKRISQRLFCVREADAVLAQVCARLCRIELDVHIAMMHIICI